ncbi:hypothetical protein PGT21_018865 [Puccinia graminis f. sp. tritici]|uniref:Uncharacterized protein n=1 Tax=Puccinia graminis f. sp. tritici TaxID=56615 RepID=A0A5B0PY60_PUCGR|nr:hypothetical protein PGT21_018865 [Puccinia graminis f. sp. tritici]
MPLSASQLPNMDYCLDGPPEDEDPIQVMEIDGNGPAKPQGVEGPDEPDPTGDDVGVAVIASIG